MSDELRSDCLDVIMIAGNVVLRDWRSDVLKATHMMTPSKARKLAASLQRMADKAEAVMPKL